MKSEQPTPSPISYIANSAIYTRTDETADHLFNFNKEGLAVVKLDGYMICPMKMFTRSQIGSALKKYHAAASPKQAPKQEG